MHRNNKIITLQLTQDEARWLANALAIASCACVGKAETMRKWTNAFAQGLNAKLSPVATPLCEHDLELN